MPNQQGKTATGDHTYTAIRVNADRGVLTVLIDHPPLNLLDAQLMLDLDHVALAAQADPDISVVVVDSANADFFIAHGDMGFADDPTSLAALAVGGAGPRNPMMRLHERWRALRPITIGVLRGLARGGGAELFSAFDLRFAAQDRAGLAQMEAPTGIIPGGGGTAYLPHLVGRARALEIMLGHQLVDAATAERYGWVNRALPADELTDYVNRLARRIADLPPGVAAATVEAVDASRQNLEAGLDAEDRLLGELFARPAAAARTQALRSLGAQTVDGERRLESLLDQLVEVAN